MTNLFAVGIEHEGVPYMFCVADSQRTGDKIKGNAQKLYPRGHNLIMGTGSAAFTVAVAEQTLQLPELDNLSAQDLAARILEFTEPLAKRFEGEQDMITEVYIAGRNASGDGLEQYTVSLLDAGKFKRGVSSEGTVYSNGSGASHVIPAFQRDMELGFASSAKSPLEALAMCFGFSVKADADIGVNTKVQYGFVTPKQVRAMMPPGVGCQTIEDYNHINSELTGVVFDLGPKTKHERCQELSLVTRTVGQFYQALETQFHRLLQAETDANLAHTLLKADNGSFAAYKRRLKDLKAAKEATEPLVKAFVYGKLPEFVQAIRDYNQRSEQTFANALKLMPKT